MLANFPGVEFLGTATKLREREGKIILHVFTSAIKRCIRKFHVVVVQGRQRNVPNLVANQSLLSHRSGRIFVQWKIRVSTIMDRSLGTLLRFWGVFYFTPAQKLPSPHKQCWTRASRIFSEFQLCIGWGEGKLQENFEKDALFYEGTQNDRKIWILHYCPRDFYP